MYKTRKFTFSMFISVMILSFCLSSAGCFLSTPDSYQASTYTVEEHIQRVSERVEKRYIKEGGEYTGYKVYPLYNDNDELAYFLVDFEPEGYLYVKLNEKSSPLGISMYLRSSDTAESSWRRFNIEIGNDERWTDSKGHVQAMGDIKFIPDENGEIVDYYDSQFKVADIADEKRYLLEINQNGVKGFIPAVKRGEKYLNLVSMEEFYYEKELEILTYAYARLNFIYESLFNL